MRAGLVTGRGQFELLEMEDPTPDGDEIVVEINDAASVEVMCTLT